MEKKPKRPPNAYLLYTEDVRNRIKKENPDLNPKELTKLIAKRYKEESPEVLQRYKDLAKAKIEEFKAQNPNYSYDKSSSKKKSLKVEDIKDPVESFNKRFLSNPFTLQCISNTTE